MTSEQKQFNKRRGRCLAGKAEKDPALRESVGRWDEEGATRNMS